MPRTSRRRRAPSRSREERSRRECHAADRLHFFKVLLFNFFEKLPIPIKFIQKFGNELSDAAVLKGPTGRVWHITLKEFDGAICFTDGWKEFTEYHSLRTGYFLVFRYDGCSAFHVQVFDTSACLKEYPITSGKFERLKSYGKIAYTPGEESDDSIQILGVSKSNVMPGTCRRRRVSPHSCDECSSWVRPLAERPHFFKVLFPNFFEKLPIPIKFIQNFGKELSDAVVLKGPTGRVWHMRLKELDGAVCFINGWKEFTEYHSLCSTYLLVFRYDGCSQFNVQVFDASACLKEYPITSEKFEENSYGQATYTPGEESDDSIQILGVCKAKVHSCQLCPQPPLEATTTFHP